MKICELHNLNTFIISEGIYYTFWICYWLILVGFNLRWTVMLAKQLFRLFAIISSCHTISLFFTSIILLVFRPLLKKKKIYCFTEFCVVRNPFDSNITNILADVAEKNTHKYSKALIIYTQPMLMPKSWNLVIDRQIDSSDHACTIICMG